MAVTESTDLDALLSGIKAIQEATDLHTLAAKAAGAILRLMPSSTGAAYIETVRGNPAFAIAGPRLSGKEKQLTGALAGLAVAGQPAAGPLTGEPGTLALPFRSDFARGALLAAHRQPFFTPAQADVMAEFARQVSVRAASLATLHRFRLLQRREGAIAEVVSAGIMVVVDGKVTLLNCAGGELLGVTPDDMLGQPFHQFWPDLAQVMDRGKSIDRQPTWLQDKLLSVTLRPIYEGLEAGCAAVTFAPLAPAVVPTEPRFTIASPAGFAAVVGVSEAIDRVRHLAQIASQSSSGVLIEGESGVGKEVLAQAIHAAGPRRRRPFVAVLCAAIPRELLESELFGYEAGSFTGASPRGRSGHFEAAEGGTLLLDDILDMPLDMQAKLLRVLQEKVVTRVGGHRPIPIDVRIIATSQPSLAEAVRDGRFRADLYYRLQVLRIDMPPLRERPEDIKSLAEHFLCKHAAALGSNLRTIAAEALCGLEAYPWPGNVRELEHWIESEIHFVSPHEIRLDRLTHVPRVLTPQRLSTIRPLREVERELYTAAVARAAGDISRAARSLGISRGKLYRKLRLYRIAPEDWTATRSMSVPE
jgi:transcriptional regulator with PAS, ATPase and Fis domain